MLSVSYMRRVRFETRMMAQEVGKMLFGDGTDGSASKGRAPNGEDIISADEMMMQMGASF